MKLFPHLRRRPRRLPEQPRKALAYLSGRPGATKRYRCDHQAEQLALIGLTVDVAMFDEVQHEDVLDTFEAFVLHRVAMDESVERFLAAAARRRKPVVFDSDDLIFDETFEAHVPESARSNDGLRRHKETLVACDAVTVSTDPLRDRAERFHSSVDVLPNVVSRQMLELAETARRRPPAQPSGGVTIAYLSGHASHDRDFLQAADAVLWAIDTYPFVRFMAVGRLNLDSRFERISERVERVPMLPWEELPDVIARADVNLAPLEPNPFAECKSCLKYVEAGLLGVPTVTSPRPDFVRAIEHGRNGLLADSPDEWRAAFRTLVESPEVRQEIGRAAFADVRRRHTTIARGPAARESLGRIFASARRPGPLIVNCVGAHSRRLGSRLAERGHVVRIYENRTNGLATADVTVATDTASAEQAQNHDASLLKCLYVANEETLERASSAFLPICASDELASQVRAATGIRAESLEGESADLADRLELILERACIVRLSDVTT